MDIAVALRAFIRTVERGSLTAAARDLSISQPAVTKHLRNLERSVGARLLERSSRIVRTTPQGQSLYETSRPALAAIESALEGVRREMGLVEGTLRLHAPSCLGAKHLHPIVMAFQTRYPAVTIDLLLSNRNVDLVYENIDLAVKYGRPEGQDLVIRRLGLVRRILVASPGLLERIGGIDTLARLSEVGVVTTPSLLSPRDTITLQRQGESYDIAIRPVLRTDNAEAIVSTLLSGHAAGPVQQLLVTAELAAGKLVRILPDYEIRSTEAFLVYPSARFMRPAVRAFIDFAVPALQAVDGITTEAGSVAIPSATPAAAAS